MLRVSKRCRLLVSLLLLCGCFLNFSLGNVSAAEVNVYPTYPSLLSTNYIKDSSGKNVIRVRAFATGVNSTLSYAGDDPTLGKIYNYSTHSQIQIEALNLTNSFVSTTSYVNVNAYIKGLDGASINNMNSVQPTTLTDYQVNVADGLSLWRYNAGYFLFRGDSAHRSGDSWYLAPNEAITITLDVTAGGIVGLTSSGQTNSGWHTSLQTAGALSSIGVSGYTDITYLDSAPHNPSYSIGEGAIDDSIQSQTQQQQQQHEEQMQQSQEQYDDFTNDGSSEGESFITDTDSTVKEKIGIFTFLDTLLENLLGLFAAPEGDAVITFPAFSMEVGGETHQIWADTQFNLSSLDDDFSVLLTAVRFGTVATVYFALINFLGDTYSRIFGGKSE